MESHIIHHNHLHSKPRINLALTPTFLLMNKTTISRALVMVVHRATEHWEADHNDWLQSVDEVLIRLSLGVAVVKLVLVPQSKLLWKFLLYLLIRHCFTLSLCHISYILSYSTSIIWCILAGVVGLLICWNLGTNLQLLYMVQLLISHESFNSTNERYYYGLVCVQLYVQPATEICGISDCT